MSQTDLTHRIVFTGLIFSLFLSPLFIPKPGITIDFIPNAYAEDMQTKTTPDAGQNKTTSSKNTSEGNKNGSGGNGDTSGETVDPFILLGIISIAGAFGGFVDGLRRESDNTLSYKGETISIGSWGDPLIGIAAAIAIFTVANALFNLGFESITFDNTEKILRVVALAVLSGFAGIRLLNPLSERLVRQLAENAARDTMIRNVSANTEAQTHILKGNQLLSDYERLGGSKELSTPGFDIQKAKDILKKAAISFDLAIEIDDTDKQSLLGKSLVLRRQADIAGHEKRSKDRSSLWNDTFKILNRIIKLYPNSPKAYYNRACYKIVSGISTQEAQSDLDEAIKLQFGFKEYAKDDDDFRTVRREIWFTELTK